MFNRKKTVLKSNIDFFEVFKSVAWMASWKDKKGRYLYCNQAFARYMGVDKCEDVIGKTDYDFLSESNAARNQLDDLDVIGTSLPKISENSDSLSLKIPLCGNKKTDSSLVTIIINIQQYKKDIEKNQYLLEEIVASMPGHIYWKDRNGIFLGCNEQQALDVGLLSRHEYVGKNDYDIINRSLPENLRREHANAIIQADREIIDSGIPKSVEELVIKLDGSEATYLSQKKPLYDSDGSIVGLLGISVDITERKRLEEQLHLAKLQAETANKLKTEFIQNMQHDIRTPISGIWSVMNGFMRKPDPEGLQAVLPHLLKATDELLSICNEVIDFENAAYGEEAILIKPISLLALGNSVIDLNSAAIIARGLYLKLDIAADVPDRILTDVHRLKKILINLIGNAIKFTNQGGITLSIQLLNQVDNSVDLAFKVQDTGIGIPEDKIGLIYDKFTRLNQSNTQLYRGTGLGLFVVKKFVEELGGTVTVTSQVGEGTCFTVKLKVDAIIDDEPKTQNAKTAVVGQLNQEQSTAEVDTNEVTHSVDNKPPILIIEDDALALYAAERIFEQLQPEVQLIAAKNKADAIRLLAKQEFKLVISDLGLPDGSGSEIAQHVKQDATHINHHTPMIALTAHNDIARHQEALNQGFVSVLCKPLTIQRAQQLLNLYLLSESS